MKILSSLVALLILASQSTYALAQQDSSHLSTCEIIKIKEDELSKKRAEIEVLKAAYAQMKVEFDEAQSKSNTVTKITIPAMLLASVSVVAGSNYSSLGNPELGLKLIGLGSVVIASSVAWLLIDSSNYEEVKQHLIEANKLYELSIEKLNSDYGLLKILYAQSDCK